MLLHGEIIVTETPGATEPQPKEKAKRKGREVHAKIAKRFLRVRCGLFARVAVIFLPQS